MPSTTSVTLGGVPLPLELLTGAAGPGPSASRAAGSGATSRVLAARTATTGAAGSASKATSARKATSSKAATAKKTTARKSTGYATRLPADYGFLRDPKLSIEEKLSRFIGLLMAKSERDLLAQMEKMAPGSTAASASRSGSTAGGAGGAAGSAAAAPKSTKLSLWGLAKSLLPPLNLASQLLGDAKLKALVTQVSGPVLAAAATAVGLPQLAPLAAKFGPTLVGVLTRDISLDVAALTGGTNGSSGTSSNGATSPSGGGSTSKAGPAEGATSEKAQLMELQRLQDRDKELFTLFSNMLKAMHDTRMTSIQNIR